MKGSWSWQGSEPGTVILGWTEENSLEERREIGPKRMADRRKDLRGTP
jgi:hypothetical protein